MYYCLGEVVNLLLLEQAQRVACWVQDPFGGTVVMVAWDIPSLLIPRGP